MLDERLDEETFCRWEQEVETAYERGGGIEQLQVNGRMLVALHREIARIVCAEVTTE